MKFSACVSADAVIATHVPPQVPSALARLGVDCVAEFQGAFPGSLLKNPSEAAAGTLGFQRVWAGLGALTRV